MPTLPGAPAWARELALSYESGAHGQFILFGNVHDRLAVKQNLVNLASYLESELLAGFSVVISFDLGNGLVVERGAETIERWGGAGLSLLPREPIAAIQCISRFLRYLGNLRALGRESTENVAVIIRGVDQVLPAGGSGFQHGCLTSLLRDWASESPFSELPFTCLLIADNLSDVESLVALNPSVARIRIPLPEPAALLSALRNLAMHHAQALPDGSDLVGMSHALAGVTVAALESSVRMRAHVGTALSLQDVASMKKSLVERDSVGLIEFIEPRRSLAHYHGQESLKNWLKQDMALWQAGDLKALPMGYLVCGPVGTGKTFLVECLAGEAQVPVIKLKNFRDRWVGSSEGNLEKVFRLIRALGRCIVFIDEADQTLGRRDSGSNDSGLSGRLYSMIAQEMADTQNRGRVIWLLASSRPDLIEVDLKRPGRIDVKVPLLPTASLSESAALIAALGKRYGLDLGDDLVTLGDRLPLLLTPGAAEALVVKAYRHARTQHVAPRTAFEQCLTGYQNPVPADVLEFQMRIAVREASDLSFVDPKFRHLADESTALRSSV